jgi:hypothetical protein
MLVAMPARTARCLVTQIEDVHCGTSWEGDG